jgi:hypothetical protein
MSTGSDDLQRYKELSDTPREIDEWETREGLMSEEDVRRLSHEKGKGLQGVSRSKQAGEVGPNAERPGLEGGRAGEYRPGRDETPSDQQPLEPLPEEEQ